MVSRLSRYGGRLLFSSYQRSTSERRDVRGAALVSYLLFEQAYTRELMDLGRADTLARRAEVCRFFGWNDPGTALPPPANDSDTDGFS